MGKKTTKVSPVDRAQQFLNAHDEILDLRLHALLLFNAFESALRGLLAWRLSCPEEKLPKSLTNSTSQLVDAVLCQYRDTRPLIDAFLAARNAIAHRFHDPDYETKLELFAMQALRAPWPPSEDEKRRLLSRAVWHLTMRVAMHVDKTPDQRGDFPFPELVDQLRRRSR